MSNIYHTIRQEEPKRCGHCNEPILDFNGYHPECYRNYKEREALMLRQRQEKSDLDLYGEVLSNHERNLRENPNTMNGYDGLTYNQRLEKQAKEKQQQEFKKMQDEDIESRRIAGIMNSLCVVQMKTELEYKIKTLEQENAKLREGV
jgi:hypothetical protein